MGHVELQYLVLKRVCVHTVVQTHVCYQGSTVMVKTEDENRPSYTHM